MKKSVYSLVLMDDVVEAIDQMAYRMGTSRSNLINQILAERVSFVTPERRMRDIFDCIRNIMDSHFQIQGQASEAMLSIRSPLRFKYKPTIRYKVELLREPKDSTFGFLTVSFRTQSARLMEALSAFFEIWSTLENDTAGENFHGGIQYELSDGKYIRSLKLPKSTPPGNIDTEQLGEAIGGYIGLIDSEIKIFFGSIDVPEAAAAQMKLFYDRNIDKAVI